TRQALHSHLHISRRLIKFENIRSTRILKSQLFAVQIPGDFLIVDQQKVVLRAGQLIVFEDKLYR
ncbi:hypothetical protein PFISCL1PPCAC_17296, partial [Pristionchus fissidentatus]